MQEFSTKNKILAAARKLFVEHGYAGTSVGKIAKLADVNHSLVFHHFQNKEQLWIAVKENIVTEADSQNKTLPDTNLPFEDFLEKVFDQCTRFYRENPDIIHMINWQRVEHKVNQNIGITNSSEMQSWIMAFKHYQGTGDINPALKPEFIITMTLGIISSSALDPNVFLADKHSQNEYMEFCVSGLVKMLK
jgi:AcrR family transcriptional regulator